MVQAARALVSESDIRLMRRVQGGEAVAFGLLYDRYATRAFRTALAVCRDPGRAEDVVQESFLYLWRNRIRFRSSGSFCGWILLIARHRAIDSVRREATRPPLAEAKGDLADPAPSVPAQVIATTESHALRAYLARLPEAQVEVIVLAFFGHMTHPEIADRLSLPAGTVKGRMRLGLEKLAREMDAAAQSG